MQIKFTVNGKYVELEVPPKKRLLDILRDDLDLIGTKEGCGKGECGACTVLLNRKRVISCLIPALQLPGSHVITIEGLRNWSVFKAIEKTYIEHGAVQCGFCISGFVLSSTAFLMESPNLTSRDQIKWGLSGNLCRCTGYSKIVETIYDLSTQSDMVQQIYEDWQKAFGD